jgi:hypothetical protein
MNSKYETPPLGAIKRYTLFLLKYHAISNAVQYLIAVAFISIFLTNIRSER